MEYNLAAQNPHNPSGKFASGGVVDLVERLVPWLGFSRSTASLNHF